MTIGVSAEMGGIWVSVQRPPWPLIGSPKSGRKCDIIPANPNKGDKIKAQKKQQKPKIKHFHCGQTLGQAVESRVSCSRCAGMGEARRGAADARASGRRRPSDPTIRNPHVLCVPPLVLGWAGFRLGRAGGGGTAPLARTPPTKTRGQSTPPQILPRLTPQGLGGDPDPKFRKKWKWDFRTLRVAGVQKSHHLPRVWLRTNGPFSMLKKIVGAFDARVHNN